MTVSDTDLSNALLVSTSDGTYPDSDEVLTTELEGAPLLRSLQLIRESKHGIEVGCLPPC